MKKDYLYCRLMFDQNEVDNVIAEWRSNHKEEYYDITTLREQMAEALRHTRTYHLRKPDMKGTKITTTESTRNVLDMVNTPVYDSFPLMQKFVQDVGQKLFGGWTHLGRVFVTKLGGECDIGMHIDEGAYFDALHRFHLVLESTGSEFYFRYRKQTSHTVLNEGELWVINNSVPHWVRNTDSSWRTHLIFDGV